MVATLDLFLSKLTQIAYTYLVPAVIVGALLGLVVRKSRNWIAAKLHESLNPKIKPSRAEQNDMPRDSSPCCPDCRRPMVKRTVRRGENRGAHFWGCPTFPTCRGTRAMG